MTARAAWTRVGRAGAAAVVAALAAADALLLELPVRRIPLRIAGLFNEGWNAYHAERAFGSGPLYPDPASLLTNNYPPLSYWILGSLGAVTGDHIVAGRALALASLGAVALFSGCIAHRLTGSRLLGAFAALLLLGVAMLHLPAYVAMNDPQWLAHAFMTAALLVFLGPHTRRRLACVAALALAGGLVKHSLLALPLALTLWLAWHDRAALRAWLQVSLGGAALCLLGLALVFGGDVFQSVVATPREVRVEYLWIKARLWLPPLLPLVAGSALLVALDRRDPRARLLGLYALTAALFGAVMLQGAGVSYNALFDLLIAGSIASAVAVARLAERLAPRGLPPAAVRAAALLLLALPVIVPAPRAIARIRAAVPRLAVQEALDAQEIEFIAARPGPALCSRPSICYWAGKAFEVDLFNAQQRAASGAGGEAGSSDTGADWRALERLFEERYFAVVQLGRPDPRRPPSRLEAAALRHYRVAKLGTQRMLLVPRGEDDATP